MNYGNKNPGDGLRPSGGSGGDGTVRKHFGALPSADAIRRLTGQGSAVNRPLQSVRGVREADLRSQVQAPFWALPLFGPGAEGLRTMFLEHSPTLELESGRHLHWVHLGDPRRSSDEFRQFLDAHGTPLKSLFAEWNSAVETRVDEAGVVPLETQRLAEFYGVSVDQMPVLLLFSAGAGQKPFCIPLPRGSTTSIELAREVLRVLRDHLGGKELKKLAGTMRTRNEGGRQRAVADHVLALQKALAQVDPAAKKDNRIREEREMAARRCLDEGATLNTAARAAGVSRTTLRNWGLKSCRSRKHQSIPRGAKHDGRIEVSADPAHGESDGAS